MQEALDEIPKPTMSFKELTDLFASKGLGVRDLVWLSGSNVTHHHATAMHACLPHVTTDHLLAMQTRSVHITIDHDLDQALFRTHEFH
jgi:hypothetical protein